MCTARRASGKQRRRRARPRCPAGLIRSPEIEDADRERNRDRTGRAREPKRRTRTVTGDTPEHRRGDRHNADSSNELQPRHARVTPGAECVDERNRPRCVGKPVQPAPGAVTDPRSQEARDRQSDEQIERDRTETEPDRPIWRGERQDGTDERDRRVAVGDGGDHVNGDEDEREQREVPVQTRDHEARPTDASPACCTGDAEHDNRGQQKERDDARAPRHEPEDMCAHDGSSGQPATHARPPVMLTSLEGNLRAASHVGASSTRKDAVLAMFASTQLPAATLTVLHGERAGRPVRGSIR